MTKIRKCGFLPAFFSLALLVVTIAAVVGASPIASAQDWVRTGTNLGAAKIRIAAADFAPASQDPQTPALKATFDATFFSDLNNAGIFDLVSKSLAPPATPATPQQIILSNWSESPVNAEMVAMGSVAVNGGRVVVSGWLLDAKNTQSPQVLGKQYNETASEDTARLIAHRFADEIILRLGGGINGIAETHIFYISSKTGTKEVWEMDYDGQGAQQVTHLGSISLSPHVSPDNSRIAFSSLGKGGWSVRMYSLVLNRLVAFQSPGGTTQSPAWSADGTKLAYSSSVYGDTQIFIGNADGAGPHAVTSFRGPNVSPCFNPKTGSQIAWAGGRTSLPQIYIADNDGGNVQRMTDGGYATSPSWSSNGQFLAFAWDRQYGPGAPGGRDIYIMDIASKRWTQLTHDAGSNDFPSWAPDGRHIVFEREINHRTDVWSMLADGTQQQQLTHSGNNFMPNWSWK
jgi:TolB protein